MTLPNFQWNVLILDDNPGDAGIKATITQLRERDFIANELGARPSDLATSDLRNVDFVFCDMKWDNFKSGAGEIAKTFIPRSLGDDVTGFINQWVDAVRYWAGPNAPTGETTLEWPRAPITDADIGLWLAALMATLNDGIQVILYSGFDEIGSDGALAALGRFPRPQFEVLLKGKQNQPLELRAFWPFLETLQKRWLTARRELRQWLMADLVIPVLLGRTPVDREFQSLRGTEKITYRANYFFPNAVVGNALCLTTLSGFLDFKPGLTPWEETSVEDLKHDIKSALTRLSGKLDQASHRALIERCYECGEVGIPIARILESAGDDQLKRALAACGAILANRESDLLALCAEYGGGTVYDVSASVFRPGTKRDRDKTNPPLRFDYHVLRSAVHALKLNADKYGSTRNRLDAVISSTELTITWLDNSAGFPTWDVFKNKVEESVERGGGYRGIPLAILFGLRYRASRISVLTSDREWHSLWPSNGSSVSEKSLDYSFGMRWSLPLP
jgi:hypothetical protein